MNTNNNKKGTIVLHDLRSQEEKDKTRYFDMSTVDTPYTEDYNRKQRALKTFLGRLYNHYDVIEVERWTDVTGKKQSAAQFASKHIIICSSTSLVDKSEEDTKYLENLLYKAMSNQKKADKCAAICKRGECARTCERAVRPYCPHRDDNGYDLRLKYGLPEVRVYSYHETKVFTLCSDKYKANIYMVDSWHSIVQDAKQRYKECKKLIKDNERLEELLQVETPWLGYDNLESLLNDCGDSWELFMDFINSTTDLIQSEGVWDVEVGYGVDSLRYTDGSVTFTTTKSENGSVALTPRRQVYVKTPKTKLVDTILDCDKIALFLSLTFYKYAGLKPMLPVVQVYNGNGTTDYKLDYSADCYFSDDANVSVDDDMDIADLTYLAHYEDEEDTEDSEDDNESDEDEFIENHSDVDTEVDWNSDEDDYDFKTSEFTGTNTSVSLLVTDDRKAQPFSFKINFFEDYTPVKCAADKRVYVCELMRKQEEKLKELESEGKLTELTETAVATSEKKVPVEERLSWALADYSYYWMMMNKAKYKFEFEEYRKGFYRAMNILKKINAKHAGLVDIQAVSTDNGISRAALQELVDKFN